MTTDTVGKDTVGKAAILRLQTAYRKRIAKKRVAGFKLLRAQQVRLPAFVRLFVCLFVCLFVAPNDPQRHTYGLLVQVVAPGWERRLAYPSGEIFYYNPTTGACMRVRVVCG